MNAGLEGWLGVFLVLASPFAGSFVSASARGWPDPGNLSMGRSRCAACGRALRPSELVPLFSFLVQRGRCMACGAPIARQHFVAELASMLIAIAAVLVFSGWMMLAGVLFGEMLLFVALVDSRTRLIPDGAVAALLASGLLLAFLRAGPGGLAGALAGALAGYGAFWLVAFLYRVLRKREGLGLGDAKLLAAGGAWCGLPALPWIVLLAASASLVAAVLMHRRRLHGETALAFGPALAAAIYGVWLWSGVYSYA